MQHPWRKLLTLLALAALPGFTIVRELPASYTFVAGGLYAAVSGIGFFQVRADKRRAGRSARRIPERSLHLVELLGAWPGALVAQQVYRHKTRKVSFQVATWGIVLVHQAAWAAWLWRARF